MMTDLASAIAKCRQPAGNFFLRETHKENLSPDCALNTNNLIFCLTFCETNLFIDFHIQHNLLGYGISDRKLIH